MKLLRHLLFAFIASSTFSMKVACTEEVPGFSWGVGAETYSDNNIYKLGKSLAQSDNVISLKPKFGISGIKNANTFNLAYQGAFYAFNKNSGLNYFDHKLELRTNLSFTNRINAELFADLNQGIEEPGANTSPITITLIFPSSPNETLALTPMNCFSTFSLTNSLTSE